MKRIFAGGCIMLLLLYIMVCSYLYLNQERFIFIPKYLDKNYQYNFNFPFEEKWIQSFDSVKINGIYAKENKLKKGIVLFLHRNGGSLQHWGNIAPVFLSEGYDFMAIDYRSYGKSHGYFNTQEDFLKDINIVYDSLLLMYSENEIIVVGHSLGSAPATWLASNHHPHKLVLLAPFFSIKEEMKNRLPIIPSFILKYPFENNVMIQSVSCPVNILHGKNDAVISFKESQKLFELATNKEQYILISDCDHSEILFSDSLKGIL